MFIQFVANLLGALFIHFTVRRYIDVHVRIYTYINIMYVHMDVFTIPAVHIQYMTYGVIRQTACTHVYILYM